MDHGPPDSSVHVILQARILEWVAISFSSDKVWSEVAQSCPTLCNPMDCSPSGSSVQGIFQARVLEGLAIAFSLLCGFFCNCREWTLLSSCGAWASHCGGFSCWGAQAPGCMSFSSCGSWALEHRLTATVALRQVGSSLLRDETTSPALSCWFFATGPPGKPACSFLIAWNSPHEL